MRKETADETRARKFCEFIVDRFRYSPYSQVVVEWYKSPTWGHCPRVLFPNGEKVVSATGYGYCKHSTVLACALQFLAPDEESRKVIMRTAGAGVPATIEALRLTGYELRLVADGPKFDAYHISPLAPVEES